jgi:hypothetical protein
VTATNLGFIEIVDIQLALSSIDRDLCIYRQKGIALVHGNRKIFSKQTKSRFLIGLDPHRKYRNFQFTKSDHPIFANLFFLL